MTRSFLFVTVFLFPMSAHAHIGHVGELAGHAHWVGVAAALGAAALAALAAKAGKKQESADDEQAVDDETEDQIEGAAT